MILLYRYVDLVAPTSAWVTAEQFEAQIKQLEGRQFVYLSDYRSPATQVCVTFDGGYENVLRHAVPVLRRLNLPFEIFVIGDKIGAWNHEDVDQPLTRFMTMDGLDEAVESGARLQWGGRTAESLHAADEDFIDQQLDVSLPLRSRFAAPHFRWFAYPGGLHDQRSLLAVSSRFDGAVASTEGDPSNPWNRLRVTMDSAVQFGE